MSPFKSEAEVDVPEPSNKTTHEHDYSFTAFVNRIATKDELKSINFFKIDYMGDG
ncbi:hypothetical protein GCM10025751_54080 [Haladaptatus pallidirubidus]|uniref:Uncharacterized protein n=1 Tax=Haladaptatus pallidirubidus TaxID=1008152 RepID=A0AAV3UQT9_9EURY